MQPLTLTPRDLAYLDELAADIAAHGGFQDRPLDQVLQEAHGRRQAFAREVLEGQTPRVRMAREVLATSTWARLAQAHAVRDTVRRCALLAER